MHRLALATLALALVSAGLPPGPTALGCPEARAGPGEACTGPAPADGTRLAPQSREPRLPPTGDGERAGPEADPGLLEALSFQRPRANTTILPHDGAKKNNAVLLIQEGATYPFKLFTGAHNVAYEARTFAHDPDAWHPFDRRVPNADDILRCRGAYWLFATTGDVYRSLTLDSEADPWRRVGHSPAEDAGYYCGEDALHAIGEDGTTHGWSGQRARHYVSPDGQHWTARSVVADASHSDLGLGDFDLFTLGDTECYVFDNSTGPHPAYHVGLRCVLGGGWDDPSRSFGNVLDPLETSAEPGAVSPNGSAKTYGDEHGINDPSIAFHEASDTLYLVAQGHPDRRDHPYGGIHGYQLQLPEDHPPVQG